jgi:glyoxylase-like metal-dependent hydrolase (beta-lactamase superfamily II)
MMKEIQIGTKKVTIIEWGEFKVDGGTLFGHVPRMKWKEKLIPDKNNLVKLSSRSILIESKRKKILVDTGFGDKTSDLIKKQHHINNYGSVPSILKEMGLKTGDIDEVVLTHLHIDHTGGNT